MKSLCKTVKRKAAQVGIVNTVAIKFCNMDRTREHGRAAVMLCGS